jgi:guanylate kinase
MEKNIGTVYVIAAASGTGKTSLVKALAESLDNILTSISYTTRPKRDNERDGENYFFVSLEQFEKMITRHEFLEYAKIFGHYYGTSKKWVEQQLANGTDVILEIDWQGAEQIKKLLPDSIGIFILPPSIEELQRRLHTRNLDDAKIIAERLSAASDEINHAAEFDYIVINDKFDVALADLQAIIHAQRLRKDRQLINQHSNSNFGN